MSVVALQKIKGPLEQALEDLLRDIAAELPLAGRSVLIKPNLVEPIPYTTGQTTNPALVEAIIRWCRQRGAAQIAIGEGPSYFQPRNALRQCFTHTGMAAVAERQGVEWILFDEHPMRKFSDCSPDMPRTFYLSEHAFAWDAIINVPVPKPHYLTTVSNAMKNLKGFIRREDKPSFHHCGTHQIHGAVTALNCLVRPALNIVDGTAPTHRNASFVIAGTDIVATDSITASLMGVDPRAVPTITLGAATGLGEMDLARIELTGHDGKDLLMCFEQPEAFVRRSFPALQLCARTACSGCLIPLFAGLRRLDRLGLRIDRPVRLACGPGAEKVSAGKALFVGECARAASGQHAWLAGCPPAKDAVFGFLNDNLCRKSR